MSQRNCVHWRGMGREWSSLGRAKMAGCQEASEGGIPTQKWGFSFKGLEIGFCDYPKQRFISKTEEHNSDS